uniref:Uncharacterized protein n=1 Tax=Rhizophora mucronata TaxID=61149 RepID=A0A2P2ISA1_RHIMU
MTCPTSLEGLILEFFSNQ